MVGDPFSDKSGEGFGDVEANVRADLAALVTGHPFGETLGAMARRLAREMDATKPGGDRVTAPISGTARELRMTVAELAKMGAGDGDDFEAALGRPTPPPVRDPENS